MRKLKLKKLNDSIVPLYKGHTSYRNGISAILSKIQKGEDTPVDIDLTISPMESQGLPEAEKPHLVEIVQGNDGIIWVKQEFVEGWQEIDNYEDCIPRIYQYLMFEL